MSGGSWDYLCYKVEEAADRLIASKNADRKALGRKLALYSKALHAIEWVDSGDCSEGHETEPIKAALGENAESLILKEIITQAQEINSQLYNAILEAKTRANTK